MLYLPGFVGGFVSLFVTRNSEMGEGIAGVREASSSSSVKESVACGPP